MSKPHCIISVRDTIRRGCAGLLVWIQSVGYWGEADKPTETAYREYWLEAIEKFKKDGPPL